MVVKMCIRDSNQSTTYTIVLPKYDETLKDIIFIDDFNVNGIPFRYYVNGKDTIPVFLFLEYV